MASFYDTTVGQQIEFQRVLASAGFTDVDIARIIKKPNLASAMYASIQPVASVMCTAPSLWYVSPENQLEHVKRLNTERGWDFSEVDIPSAPQDFMPRSNTEVLMLTVHLPEQGKVSGLQRTFDELWSCIKAPNGYTKWSEVNYDNDKHLRQVPGYEYTPGIRWVAFDPNTFLGKSPEEAIVSAQGSNAQLAGVETLMAALLFPTWATSWNGDSSPYPILSGLEFYWEPFCSQVPLLYRWDVCHRLELLVDPVDCEDDHFASPVVREC